MQNRSSLDLGLTAETAPSQFAIAASAAPSYPGGFGGRGIVIPGGGHKYFPGAWVCVNMLRRVGCSLPIELWHLGPTEMTDEMHRLVEPLSVHVVDAWKVREKYPARILNGWELKPYAILQCRFEEVLLLDADNMPVVDPTPLFENSAYRDLGSIFWPDLERLGADREIWRLTGVIYRDEPEFESGQMLINKRICWRPLSLAMWMNEHSDFWYDHLHGDKETFHLAWRKLNIRYAMPSHGVHLLDGAMCQHDFSGRRLFQHRNTAKWMLANNRHVEGFLFEDECFAMLTELRERREPIACDGGMRA